MFESVDETLKTKCDHSNLGKLLSNTSSQNSLSNGYINERVQQIFRSWGYRVIGSVLNK